MRRANKGNEILCFGFMQTFIQPVLLRYYGWLWRELGLWHLLLLSPFRNHFWATKISCSALGQFVSVTGSHFWASQTTGVVSCGIAVHLGAMFSVQWLVEESWSPSQWRTSTCWVESRRPVARTSWLGTLDVKRQAGENRLSLCSHNMHPQSHCSTAYSYTTFQTLHATHGHAYLVPFVQSY